MAKRIKSIVEKLEFYFGKKETGYNSPSDIVRELNVESINVFNELHDEYSRTRKISEFLQPFLKKETVTINTSGIGDKPEDFAHADGSYMADGTKVDILESNVYIERMKHVNKPPSTEFPILRMYGGKIEVLPKAIESIELSYFRLPAEAVYAFTANGDQYDYNDSESADWEWSKVIEDRIINRTLSNVGINIKDRDLIQFSQSEKMQE